MAAITITPGALGGFFGYADGGYGSSSSPTIGGFTFALFWTASPTIGSGDELILLLEGDVQAAISGYTLELGGVGYDVASADVGFDGSDTYAAWSPVSNPFTVDDPISADFLTEGGSGVEGDAALTDSDDAISGDGALPIIAAAALSDADDVIASGAGASAATADATIDDGSDGVSSDSLLALTGAAALSDEDDAVLSTSGAVGVVGEAALNDGDDVVAFDGSQPVVTPEPVATSGGGMCCVGSVRAPSRFAAAYREANRPRVADRPVRKVETPAPPVRVIAGLLANENAAQEAELLNRIAALEQSMRAEEEAIIALLLAA